MNNQFRREHGKPLQQKNQSEIALRVMNWAFWLGTLALILISVTSCNEVKLAVNTDIESPLRNTCQSGDLDPTFPKCPERQLAANQRNASTDSPGPPGGFVEGLSRK